TSTRSFIRNPDHSGDNPGVVKRKLSVMAKVLVAPRLPITDRRGHHGRTASKMPMVNSMTPIRFEAPVTLVTAYSQPRKGLLGTQGWMVSASPSVNLARPKRTRKRTRL